MENDPGVLERQAHEALVQDRLEEAFKLFKAAGFGYKARGDHQPAALCFASAGSCWSRRSGEKLFYNAAEAYEAAANEAQESGDLEYASALYKYAAINHERDQEFLGFSECFYQSKEARRRFLFYSLAYPGKIHTIRPGSNEKGAKAFFRRFLSWLMLTFSALVWGHGERPWRTLATALAIIFISAGAYTQGTFRENGTVRRLQFSEAVYVSSVTFTTVGYGDITPVGPIRGVAMLEAFCGLVTSSLLIVALTRKYLRM